MHVAPARVTPPVWQANIVEAFDVLHAEGGNVFNLTLHPWITGQAHRIRYLRDALHRYSGQAACLAHDDRCFGRGRACRRSS